MIAGELLVCPKCWRVGKMQKLGRLLPNGDFLVMRYHHGTTLLKIEAKDYSVYCGCGFVVNISGTVVSKTEAPFPTEYNQYITPETARKEYS